MTKTTNETTDWTDRGDGLAREDERAGNGCLPYDEADVLAAYEEDLSREGERVEAEEALLAGYAARAKRWPRDSPSPLPPTCGCCGGGMPKRSIWEQRRDEAGECDGGVDGRGRCRAWSDDGLWTVPSRRRRSGCPMR